MSIFELIKADHLKVKSLLAQLVSLSDASLDKHELIETIRDELVPHSRAEEMVFYNTLRSLPASKNLVAHNYREHLEAERLLRSLQVRDKIDTDWKETAEKLKTVLEHHIQDEETRVFTGAKEVLSDSEAEMMGKAFEKLKPEIREESIMGTTMDLIMNMMPPRFTSTFRKNEFRF